MTPRERPIIFSGPMVRAILGGRKTQTRRVVKGAVNNRLLETFANEDGEVGGKSHAREGHGGPGVYLWHPDYPDEGSEVIKCPFGVPGDRLWVRETWGLRAHFDSTTWFRGPVSETKDYQTHSILEHRADYGPNQDGCLWRPSIYMPRWASRITLEVTGVRVERLQTISEEDAKAEGLKGVTKDGSLVKYGIPDRDGWPGTDDDGWPWSKWRADPREAFRSLWEGIHGPGSWDLNPWVWVIEFRRVEP